MCRGVFEQDCVTFSTFFSRMAHVCVTFHAGCTFVVMLNLNVNVRRPKPNLQTSAADFHFVLTCNLLPGNLITTGLNYFLSNHVFLTLVL